MKIDLNIQLEMSSSENAEALYQALAPEVKSDSRVQTKISIHEDNVFLRIRANDRSAARSAASTYGRWLKLFEEIGGIK